MERIILLNKEHLKIFLEFVEIRTKIASIVPMTLGILWSIYRYQSLNWLNSLLFIIAVLCFDMCTTAINNTMDYIKAKSETYKETENVIGVYQLTLRKMVYIIFTLLVISIIFSLILVMRTDVILLVLGVLCFIVGISYTFGPLPISRTPLGELFSGFTMGFGIFFLAVFTQDSSQLISTSWTNPSMIMTWNWLRSLEIFLMSLPLVSLIANIMLANNTCDLEMDIVNERHTLVFYIGKEWAVRLYQILSILPWVIWLFYLASGLLPIWAVIAFGAIYPHSKSVLRFTKKQVKRETFAEAIKSFKLFALVYILTLILAIVIQFFN